MNWLSQEDEDGRLVFENHMSFFWGWMPELRCIKREISTCFPLAIMIESQVSVPSEKILQFINDPYQCGDSLKEIAYSISLYR